ncbi:MAG: TetR/AcrR family transcriptional regulator [Chloroflexi bacterium]|nr:TetR/AcrR family transcriptional regulator [Chloroflexota bacterium]
MARNYDSSRRQDAARRTREAILAAAFKLHGEGVLDLDTLAREADVSVATVRKHFPNRELLFEGCTTYGLHLVPLPDFAALAAITDPRQRLARAVHEAYGFHEALFGQIWSGFKLEDESPALAATVRQVESVAGALAERVVEAWPDRGDEASELRGLVAGMLSPLTYRGLRLHGGLSPEQATRGTTTFLLQAFEAGGLPAGEEVAHN